MPITEAQAKANQEMLERANANPIKVKMTGKSLAFDPEKDDWVTSEVPLSPRLLKIRWGWMGKNYGPDENGIMRELKGRVDGKMTFGGFIPEAGFIHHNQTMKTAARGENSNVIAYEVIPVGEGEPSETKPLEKMTIEQLVAVGVEKGLKKEDLEVMKKADLVALLKS